MPGRLCLCRTRHEKYSRIAAQTAASWRTRAKWDGLPGSATLRKRRVAGPAQARASG